MAVLYQLNDEGQGQSAYWSKSCVQGDTPASSLPPKLRSRLKCASVTSPHFWSLLSPHRRSPRIQSPLKPLRNGFAWLRRREQNTTSRLLSPSLWEMAGRWIDSATS